MFIDSETVVEESNCVFGEMEAVRSDDKEISRWDRRDYWDELGLAFRVAEIDAD